jgi:hypothetical protein
MGTTLYLKKTVYKVVVLDSARNVLCVCFYVMCFIKAYVYLVFKH